MKFQKKPVVIDAVQFTGDNIEEIWDAYSASNIYGPTDTDPNAYILTLEGKMQCSPNDWIIQGVRGELYPCKPDIFEMTYEPVTDSNQMNHDPLCKLPNEWETFLDVDGHRTIRRRCYCEMIAKIRADEREKAAQRVAQHDVKPCDDYERSCACWHCEMHERMAYVIAAARGEAS